MKKIFGLLIIFIMFFTVNVKADNERINITDVKVIDKSSTITVDEPKLENNSIKSAVKFNEINDFVIFEVSLENKDSYDYTVDKVVDNNKSSNLLIEYDYSEELKTSGTGTLRIKLTYKNKLLNVEKISLDNLEIKMDLTKSDGTKTEVKISNPTTGDNLIKYVFILGISVVGIVLTKKKIKFKNYKIGKLMLVLPFLILPFAIFAADRFEISIKFEDPIEVMGEFEVYDISIGDDTKKVTYGQEIGSMEEPTKKGYTFDKWVDEDGNTVTEETVITKPIKVSPVFKTIEYTITYDLGDGSASNVTKYTIEDETTLNNPTKDGYTFAGWTGFNGDDLQTRVTISKGTTGNISFKAHYSTNQNTAYKVVHKYPNLDNTYEEVTENLEGATDTNVTPALLPRDGFTGPELITKKIKGDGSTTVTYTYTRNQYTINLDSEYIESDSNTDDYSYGEEITVRAKEREGYNFVRWSNGDTNIETTITVTDDLELEPIYEVITYTVTFDPNGGLVNEEERIVNYNTKIGDLPESTRVNYALLGWFNGDNEVDKNFKPTSNITLTAHWIKSIDSVTITNSNIIIDYNGNETINITGNDGIEDLTYTSNNTSVVTVNNGVVTAVSPGSTTITITGTVSGITKTVNVTVNPRTFTVTFDPVDGQVTTESVSVNEGESINSFPQADKYGYEFIGWFNGDDEIITPYAPTSDITLTAHYEEINKSVQYTDSDNDGTISLGDFVKIGNNGFYVIGTEDSQVKLLAQYNLDSNSRQSEDNYQDVTFSGSDYWNHSAGSSSSSSSSSSSENEKYIDYNNYSYYGYYYYIYRDSGNNDTDNNLYSYVNNYKDYLVNDVGIDVVDARLMSYEEAIGTGCKSDDESNNVNSCPAWVSNQYYWLGSVFDDDRVWLVNPDASNLGNMCYANSHGFRPLVIVEESVIPITVSFDTQGGSSAASMKVPAGEQVGRLPNSHKDDKVLAGWYTDTNYTTQVTASTIVTGNVTYYAKWVTPTGVAYSDTDGDGNISLGDKVMIGNDGFWVIAAPSDGKVKLLSEYNLNSSSRQESSSNYVKQAFSSTNYWWDSSNSRVYDTYSKDAYNYPYIYRISTGEETNNNLKTYINNYKDYLISLGATNIEDARLMSYEEARGTGCTTNGSSCPTYVANQWFWLGSARDGNRVWGVYSAARDLGSSDSNGGGVRPVIIVEESAIEFANTHYRITFDYQYNSKTEIKNIEMGSALATLPEKPTRSGWKIAGWYADTNYTIEVTTETVPIENTTYYAKWAADITYTSTYGSSISGGVSIKIGDDMFYAIGTPSDGKVKLLAKYNLNSNSRQESSDDYLKVQFADTDYWSGTGGNRLKDEFSNSYIYRDRNNNDTDNNLKSYINSYKDYLISLGATNIEDARLMSYQEARSIGCKYYNEYNADTSCPTWVANQGFFTGSQGNYAKHYVYFVSTNRYLNDLGYRNVSSGIRPLLIVPYSSISTP